MDRIEECRIVENGEEFDEIDQKSLPIDDGKGPPTPRGMPTVLIRYLIVLDLMENVIQSVHSLDPKVDTCEPRAKIGCVQVQRTSCLTYAAFLLSLGLNLHLNGLGALIVASSNLG
jgi:hypothetical protein